MNSYQGCENVQHCRWDMWTDCIIIHQSVYNVCSCARQKDVEHVCTNIRCSYVWRFWIICGSWRFIRISTSSGSGFVLVVRLRDSLSEYENQYLRHSKLVWPSFNCGAPKPLNWRCFFCLREECIESYLGNSGCVPHVSIWKLGIFFSFHKFFWLGHIDFEWNDMSRIFIADVNRHNYEGVFLGSLNGS